MNKIASAGFLCLCMVALSAFRPGEIVRNSLAVKRKTVVREIEFQEKPQAPVKGKKEQNQTLMEMIVAAAKSGALPVYFNQDVKFTRKLTSQEIDQFSGTKYDTVVLNDLETDEEKIKVSVTKADLSKIRKYRVLENWAYNPATGKTEIRISGIAPVREVYGEQGEFRGVQPMFWMRYEDLRPVMYNHEITHHGNSLSNCIWNDYFATKAKPDIYDGVWTKGASRVIDMKVKEDTMKHHLRAMEETDTTLLEMIENGIHSGRVRVYRDTDTRFLTSVSAEDAKSYVEPRQDTQLVSDPVSDDEVVKLVSSDGAGEYDKRSHKYKILEKWSFDPSSGRTEIQINGIAPLSADNPDAKTLYGLRYVDVVSIIAYYDRVRYMNAFSDHIWDAYFLSEVKPEILK